MIQSNPNFPTFILDDYQLDWQMTRCEKFAFHSILEKIKPEVAIEIGTYKGGSLQVISKYAKKVYSVDISPSCKETLVNKFDNVEFHSGDSKKIVSNLLREISKKGENLGFVLIDGDHSTEGVRSDINSVLEHKPTCPLYIIFHDSFHPVCRKGILSADWQKSDYLHYVEVDFIPGVFHYKAFDTAPSKSMYGGLCLAVMLPEKRKGSLEIHQSQKGLYDTVYRHSAYKGISLNKIVKGIKKVMGK